MGYGDSNTFRGLRTVNVRRCEASFHPVKDWSPCDWMTAVAGEVGEAANIVKKLKRIETESLNSPANIGLLELVPEAERERDMDTMKIQVLHELKRRLGHELADVVIYLDLLAARLDIDLGAAVIEKFNMTSEKVGSKETLPY